jgi:ectoine hydroxylase-related dioxygenase (phytanoyl-CoA dioxygenase family)
MSIARSVLNDGFFVIKNFFSEESASFVKQDIMNEFEKVNERSNAITEKGVTVNEPEGGFAQGKNLRIMPSSYNCIPNVVKSVFQSSVVNDTITEYYGPFCQRFLQVFASWEKRVVTDKNLGRHSWLHADPYASLKFAFFPFGATKQNGAPKVVPNSRQEGAVIRQQFMSRNPSGIQGGIAHRMIDFYEQCPELITRTEDEAIDVEVSERDLLILDTDTYHAGGKILDDNQERIAVYIHSRP